MKGSGVRRTSAFSESAGYLLTELAESIRLRVGGRKMLETLEWNVEHHAFSLLNSTKPSHHVPPFCETLSLFLFFFFFFLRLDSFHFRFLGDVLFIDNFPSFSVNSVLLLLMRIDRRFHIRVRGSSRVLSVSCSEDHVSRGRKFRNLKED